VYAEPGIYEVTLTITAAECTDQFDKIITVTDEVLSDGGFGDEEQEISLNYYSGKIEVSASKRINNEVEVEVLNSAGQLMISKKLNGISNNVNISVDGLSAGVFWVNVRSQGMLIHSQRIIETNQ
jgi:PKD repeat protein